MVDHNAMVSELWPMYRAAGPRWWRRHQMKTFFPLCGEITGHRWIPLTKASDAELWCFLWSVPEQKVEKTFGTPVIWNTIEFIITSLQWIALNWHSPYSNTRYSATWLYEYIIITVRWNWYFFYYEYQILSECQISNRVNSTREEPYAHKGPYRYRDAHYKDKTVSRLSHLYPGTPIHVKAVFIS